MEQGITAEIKLRLRRLDICIYDRRGDYVRSLSRSRRYRPVQPCDRRVGYADVAAHPRFGRQRKNVHPARLGVIRGYFWRLERKQKKLRRTFSQFERRQVDEIF